MADTSTALLEKLGFTTYEAKAWLALAQVSSSTGYEVAKRSGIPRANVYAALKRLVERGAARHVNAHDGTRYAATPAPELLEAMRREHAALLATAQATLPLQPQAAEECPVYALQSVAHVYATARHLVTTAQRTLLVAVQPCEARLLAAELRAADERGVRITTLCMEACATECGGCRGTIHRCALAPGSACRWLIVAADDEAVVAAELNAGCGPDDTAVRALETRQPLVVKLATSYVRQSAALSILGGALGDHFEGLVSLQARHLLDGLQLQKGSPTEVRQNAAEEPRQSAR